VAAAAGGAGTASATGAGGGGAGGWGVWPWGRRLARSSPWVDLAGAWVHARVRACAHACLSVSRLPPGWLHFAHKRGRAGVPVTHAHARARACVRPCYIHERVCVHVVCVCVGVGVGVSV
jgi:hypothetical protein